MSGQQVNDSKPEDSKDSDGVENRVEGTMEDEADLDLSLLDDTQGATEQVEENGYLQVFSENCLDCKALVSFKKKTFRQCHFSRGNTECPAQNTQVVIRVPLERIVPKWLTAERNGDFARVAKMSTVLAGKPDWYQSLVKDELQRARVQNAGK